MKSDDAREIWENVSILEDWLSGGLKRERTEPDFKAAEKKAEAAKAAAAGGRASACGPDKIVGLRQGLAGWDAKRSPLAVPSVEGNPARGVQMSSVPPRAQLLNASDLLQAGETAAAALSRLEAEVANCDKCGLCAARRKTVFGMGPALPLVLVVGEGPGAEEDASGRPFVGPAGQLLDKMLSAIGLSREKNAYIANVVKCRPPNNRTPLPDEAAACLPYLEAQITLLRPKYIFCMGRTALQTMTGATEGIMKLRGHWFDFDGIPLIATYHPSALLRDESLKRPAWEDLKTLRSRFE